METCGGDPVQASRDLLASGYDLQFHIVGFDIARNVPAREQLLAIASATNGLYFDAGSSEELRNALSLVAPFTYTVYDSEDNEVFSGQIGDDVGPQLPVGTYTVVLNTTPPIAQQVTVSEQQTTVITVTQENGSYRTEVGN